MFNTMGGGMAGMAGRWGWQAVGEGPRGGAKVDTDGVWVPSPVGTRVPGSV